MISINNIVAAILRVIHRYFIWIIIVSYVIATLAPEFGLWIRNAGLGSLIVFQSHLVFSLSLFLLASLLFNAGLGVKAQDFTKLLRKPLTILFGVLVNFSAPLFFIIGISFAIKFWHNSDEAQQILVGLALVVAMPIAGSSSAWAQNANGNLALSLGLILSTTALSPFFSPLALHAVGFLTINDYSEGLHELASGGITTFLGFWVILPTILGILIRCFIGERCIEAINPYLKMMNYCVLILLSYSNAALVLPKTASQPDIDFLIITLMIVIALCIFAFVSGYLLAYLLRAERNERVSLTFGLGMNNNGTGLVLASMALSDHPQVMLPIIFYNLVQHIVGGFVNLTMFQQKPDETESPPENPIIIDKD